MEQGPVLSVAILSTPLSVDKAGLKNSHFKA